MARNTKSSSGIDQTEKWAQQSMLAGATELTTLRANIRRAPNELESRCRLIGQLFNRWDKNSRASLSRHVLFVIRHYPHVALAASPLGRLHQGLDPGYRACRDLWIAHVAKKNTASAVLFNVSRFLGGGDRDISIKLLHRLVRRDPVSEDWHQFLGDAYLLHSSAPDKDNKRSARQALKHFRLAYKLTKHADNRFYLLDNLTKAAFISGAWDDASSFAKALLEAATKHRSSWNYGNAIHHGHSCLGKIAVLQGNLKQAARHLRASLKHKGSPQLNSFGPSMELAQDILDAGGTNAVVDYLESCKLFWKNDYGALNHWLDAIRSNGHCKLNLAEILGSLSLEDIQFANPAGAVT